MTINKKQEEILLHALGGGLSSDRSKLGWRHYYNMPSGCDGYGDCENLVAIGAMTKQGSYFFVTDFGASLVGVEIKRD